MVVLFIFILLFCKLLLTKCLELDIFLSELNLFLFTFIGLNLSPLLLFVFSCKFSNNNSVNFLFPEETLKTFAINLKIMKITLTIGNPSATIKNIFL